MKITIRRACTAAPLALVAGLLAYEPETEPETVKMLGQDRTISQHPNGTRSVDLSDTPVSMMVSRVGPDGKTESRCVGNKQEQTAFENFSINPIGSEK